VAMGAWKEGICPLLRTGVSGGIVCCLCIGLGVASRLKAGARCEVLVGVESILRSAILGMMAACWKNDPCSPVRDRPASFGSGFEGDEESLAGDSCCFSGDAGRGILAAVVGEAI